MSTKTTLKNKLKTLQPRKRLSFTFFEDDIFISTLNKLSKHFEGMNTLEVMKLAVIQQLKIEEKQLSIISETDYINKDKKVVKNILKKDKEYKKWEDFEKELKS